jgi:hypothetical protein
MAVEKKGKVAKLAAVAKMAKMKSSARGVKAPNKKISGAVSMAPGSEKPKKKRKRKADEFSPADRLKAKQGDKGPVLGKRLAAIASGLRPARGPVGRMINGAISGAAIGATVGEAVSADRAKKRKKKKKKSE